MILFFLASLSLLAYSFFPIIKRGIYLLDFALFYHPVGKLLSQNLNPYQSTTPLLYSPPMLLLLYPLNFLPLTPSQLIWTTLSFLSLLLGLWLIIKTTSLKPSLYWFLLISPFFFLSFPAKFTLGMGQINHFVLLFFTLSFYLYQKKRLQFSALFLTLAFLSKFFPLWVLVFFVFKKDHQFLKNLTLYSLSAFAITALLLPFKITKDFFITVMPSFFNHTHNSSYYNQALTGLISRSIQNSTYQTYTAIVLTLLLLILTLRKIKTLSASFQFSLLITLSLLTAPVAWQHHLVFLFFPLITLLAKFLKTKQYPQLSLLLFSYLLIFINLKTPPIPDSFLNQLFLSHATLGSLIIFFLHFNRKSQTLKKS